MNRSLPTLLAAVAMLSCSSEEAPDPEVASPTFRTIGSIERIDPAIDAIVPAGAVLEVLAEGHEWTEGPVWVPAMQAVLYSDIPNNAIYRWSEAEGGSIWLQPSGYTGEVPRGGESGSNGLLLDGEGRLVLAMHGDRRIARMDAPLNAPEPNFETLVGDFEGRRFNSPNDVALGSNGDLYFTDPPYGIRGDYEGNRAEQEHPLSVYRVDADGGIKRVTDDIDAPNGLCFSPDYSLLYVSNTGAGQDIRVWDVDGDILRNGRTFAELVDPTTGSRTSADGIRCDVDGNVWAGARPGVQVVAPNGVTIGVIRLPEVCANVCFGGTKRNRLFMTASQSLYSVYVGVRGAGVA